MEGHAVDDGYEKERPMRATLCDRDVTCIIYGEEDVGSLGEVGEGFSEGEGIRRLHEHECHRGAEEDDA